MLENYFSTAFAADPLLWAQHDPWLVALSVLVSMGASAVALHMAALARVAQERGARQMALGSGALALGSGVWTMHYVGMLAFAVCGQAGFDPAMTALSVAPALLASWAALRLLVHPSISMAALALGGLLVGAGIGAMHYIGMAASTLAPLMRYDVWGFALSIVVAVALAVLALWVRFGLERFLRRHWQWRTAGVTGAAGAIMGAAIAGMHYTGMAALRFTQPIADIRSEVSTVPVQTSLALAVAVVTVALSLVAMAINASLRYRTLLGQVRASEALAQKVQEELRKKEAQLRTLVGNIPGVAFRCRSEGDWPMVFISDAVLELTGHTAQAFLQGQVHFGQIILPEDAQRITQALEHALAHGLPYHIEYRITTRSGQTRWVAEHGRGVVDENGAYTLIDGVLLDTTEAHARSAELEGTIAAINRSRAAAEFDLQGDVIHANPQFLHIMGYTLDEIIGLPHGQLCLPAYAASPEHAAFWAQLCAGQYQGAEYERVDKNGRSVWLLASYNPVFGADGKVFKIILFAANMTERRAMEQELRAAKARAEAAAAARTAFLANMSHEIRTPMNAVIGFSEALLDTPLDASQRRQLGTVNASARSLLRLLNDILDTAKLDRGAVTLELHDFSLRELCGHVLDSLRINASRKHLPLLLDYPDAVPNFLHGDALRVQQVLINLLGNAVKFTERGQVLLRVRYADGVLQLEVQDSGIGMTPEQIERVFDPFAQADASTTRRFGGTGLGTTIAQQLVQLMGGRISVQSQPGAGSCFTVRLPLPVGQEVVRIPTDAPWQLPPLRILAVDDVPANLELLQLALARGGHQISTASDGAQAIQHSAQERFDLVLMDVHMPEMDGLEATRRIRAREQAQGLARLPIIALSASVLEEDQGQARDAGMDGFAHKPLDLPRLCTEIARVLQLAAPAAPAPGALGAPVAPGTLGAASSAAPIDWARGAQLWGTPEAQAQAVARFVRDNADLPAQLHAALPQEAAVQAQAHRLRGAAGNLGLLPLAALLGQLEAAAKARDSAAMAACTDALPAAWEAVQHALPSTPEATGHGAAGPLGAAARAQALAAMAQAQAQLQSGELPEAALAQLARWLPAGALLALQEALERFDLAAAQQELAQLHAALEEAA